MASRALAQGHEDVCGADCVLFTPYGPSVKAARPPQGPPDYAVCALGIVLTLSRVAEDATRSEHAYLRVYVACGVLKNPGAFQAVTHSAQDEPVPPVGREAGPPSRIVSCPLPGGLAGPYEQQVKKSGSPTPRGLLDASVSEERGRQSPRGGEMGEPRCFGRIQGNQRLFSSDPR